MSRFDQLIGIDARDTAAIDIDLIAREVILVPCSGREIRLTAEQAHTLALGLIKAKAYLDQQDFVHGRPPHHG